MVTLHLRSAAVLRANGRAREAARVEQFAWRARLRLEEPKAVQRMRALLQAACESLHTGLLLERVLEGAITLTAADFGNVQLRDIKNGSLRIATQSGFDSEFLEYFARVADDTSACGRAASRCAQTVIADVNVDAAFAPHREIAAAARFRGVQSTPLFDATGRLRGVISTHFRHPGYPGSRDLELMQWYAEEVSAALVHRQHSPTTLYDTSARLHTQTAELQDSTAALMHEHARLLLANGNQLKSLARQESARAAENRARQERERALAMLKRARSQQLGSSIGQGDHPLSDEARELPRDPPAGPAHPSRPRPYASERDPRSS